LSCNKFAQGDASTFFKKVRFSQSFENPLENPIGGQTVLLAKGEARDDSRNTAHVLITAPWKRASQWFFLGEKKSRIVLDSARVAHKYRGQFLCRYGAFGATKEKEEADRGFI